MKQRLFCLFVMMSMQVCLFAELNEAQRWAVALSGIMTELHQASHDTLNFREMNAINKNEYLEILRRDWGVTNREELLETISVTELNGNAASLNFIKKIIVENKDYSFITVFNKFQLTARQYNYLKFVVSNWGHYYNRSILAWDWGRIISLCRWGYEVGFISEEEAWEKIMYYARKSQSLYSSWTEYGLDYYMGRIFWASGSGSEMDYLVRTDEVYQRLMGQDGYWSSLNWQVDLAF
jgi:hypothetical protein